MSPADRLRSRPVAVLCALVVVALAAGVAAAVDRSGEPAAAPAATSSTTTTEPPTTTTSPIPVDPFALAPPPAATDPAGLAGQITEAESTIRDPASTEVEVATAALAQQVAYRHLGTRPEWDEAVLAAVPTELHDVVRRHVAARRELRGMHRTLSPTLPAWRIVAPDPHEDLLATYGEAEATFGIGWGYLAAIHLVETGTGRIRGTSVAGAQGPMQFMPATWEAYGAGGDVHDTRDAIFGAARYLAANGGATDIAPALFRYNRSDRYVRAVQLYAELIAEQPRAALALYHWGVWYLSDAGDVYLPVGYHEDEPVPTAEYLARAVRSP